MAKTIGGIENEIAGKNAEADGLRLLKSQCSGGKMVKCSSCNSMVGEEHLDKEIAKLDKDIVDLESTMALVKGKDKLAKDDLEDVRKKLRNCDDYIAREAGLVESMASFKRNQEKVVEMKASRERCDERAAAAASRQAEANAEMEVAKAGVADADKSAASSMAALKDRFVEVSARLRGVEAEAGGIKASIQAVEGEMRALSLARDGLVSSRSRLETQIEDIRQMNDKVSGIIAKAMEKQAELDRVKVLEKVFGLNGIPSRIIERYMPLMNSYVAEYLDIISNHKIRARMSMDDSSEIRLSISGDGASLAELLSGGELVKIKLAFSIALGMLSFVRSANTPEFICLDEIFAPVDAGTKDYVFQTIEKLKEHFRDIIVISHDTALLTRIKNSILVNKVDGISRIERQHHEIQAASGV